MKVVVEAHDTYAEWYLKKRRVKKCVVEVDQYKTAKSYDDYEENSQDLIDLYRLRAEEMARFLEVEYEFIDNRS